MARRFVDTEIWDEDWFADLPIKIKLFWIYLFTSCDHAGVWKANFRSAEMRVGGKITKEEIDEHLTNRVVWLSDTRLWIKGFIKFQYKELNPKVPAHHGIVRKLIESGNGVPLDLGALEIIKNFNNFKETHLYPPGTHRVPIGGVQEKEKEKETVLENKKVITNKITQNLSTGESISIPLAEPISNAPPLIAAHPPANPAVTQSDLQECIEIWQNTLKRSGIAKDAKMDQAAIYGLISRNGAMAVKLALLGAGYEDSHDGYDAKKHVRISRLMKPEIFDMFVNLGGQVKPMERNYSD